MYNATYGRKRTKKHVQLGVIIKRKTASVDVIRWLNRLGHVISYDEINSVETKIAEDQIRQVSIGAYVPNNIQPGTIVTFVYDNCDHNIESIYNVTMHVTNGIIIQKNTSKEIVQILNNTTENRVNKTKRRSFKPIPNVLQPYIKPKFRANPAILINIETGINYMDGWISKCEDLIWYFLRYQCSKEIEQIISGWKGFFHEISQSNDSTDSVGYLPPINKSPTRMDTVQEILFQCRDKAKALNLEEADLVLDHAIYSKAIEVLMHENNSELRGFINLRMGGFHTVCIFLGVIGKRFMDASLMDMIIESGLLGQASASQLLKGKHYNNAIRIIHMYIAEAVMRHKLEAFIEWLQIQGKYNVYEDAVELLHTFKPPGTVNAMSFKIAFEQIQPLNTLFEEFDNVLSDSPMAN
jgi:hypothetical protein